MGDTEVQPTVTKSINSQNDAKTSLLSLEALQRQLAEDLMHQQRGLSFSETHANHYNSWGFTQGLVIGQLSVIFVIAIFIKFFVFADSSIASTSTKDASGVIVRKEKDLGKNIEIGNEKNDFKQGQGSKVKSILEKTYYDVDNHSPESLDWFNVLIAQTISQLRSEAILSDNIYHSLNEFLISSELPDYLDKIKLTEIDIGDDFPIFSNCRIKHSKDGSGRLEARIDVDLSDTLTLGIDTRLLLNHPRPLTAILPVELSVSIVRFSGCLTVSLINPNDQEFTGLENSDLQSDEIPSVPRMSAPVTNIDLNSNYNSKQSNKSQEPTGTALMFSFSPDYRLEFTVKSLIGSRAKLQDVPKISSLVENKLRSWFIERCVEPRFQVVRLPSLWPRRKNTREPLQSSVNSNSVEDPS